MAKLKPWYDAVELREDLRENRPLDASEFAIHLDQIRDGRAHKDYTDPQRFFDRTYVTASLLDLASQVLRRLSGIQLETSEFVKKSNPPVSKSLRTASGRALYPSRTLLGRLWQGRFPQQPPSSDK